MKIVVRKSDGRILQVAECATLPSHRPDTGEDLVQVVAGDVDIYDLPGWDWSLVNLSGVDMSRSDWVTEHMMWNGSAVVKRP